MLVEQHPPAASCLYLINQSRSFVWELGDYCLLVDVTYWDGPASQTLVCQLGDWLMAVQRLWFGKTIDWQLWEDCWVA